MANDRETYLQWAHASPKRDYQGKHIPRSPPQGGGWTIGGFDGGFVIWSRDPQPDAVQTITVVSSLPTDGATVSCSPLDTGVDMPKGMEASTVWEVKGVTGVANTVCIVWERGLNHVADETS